MEERGEHDIDIHTGEHSATHTHDEHAQGEQSDSHIHHGAAQGKQSDAHTHHRNEQHAHTDAHTQDEDVQGEQTINHRQHRDVQGERTNTHTHDEEVHGEQSNAITHHKEVSGEQTNTRATQGEAQGEQTDTHTQHKEAHTQGEAQGEQTDTHTQHKEAHTQQGEAQGEQTDSHTQHKEAHTQGKEQGEQTDIDMDIGTLDDDHMDMDVNVGLVPDDARITHRALLGEPHDGPSGLSLSYCPFCLEGRAGGAHKCGLCKRAVHAWCQWPSESEGSGSRGLCFRCKPGPYDQMTRTNRMIYGGLLESAEEIAEIDALRQQHGIIVHSVSTDDLGLDLDLEYDDAENTAPTGEAAPATGGTAPATGGTAPATGGVAPTATGATASATGGAASATGGAAPATGGAAPATVGTNTANSRSIVTDEDVADMEASRDVFVYCKFNRRLGTMKFSDIDKSDGVKVVADNTGKGEDSIYSFASDSNRAYLKHVSVRDFVNVNTFLPLVHDMANVMIDNWLKLPAKGVRGKTNADTRVNGVLKFTDKFTSVAQMLERAVIQIKESTNQKEKAWVSLYDENPDLNTDQLIKERLIETYNNATKNCKKGQRSAEQAKRHKCMQVVLTFKAAKVSDKSTGGTRQSQYTAQRVAVDQEQRLGPGHETEARYVALQHSRNKKTVDSVQAVDDEDNPATEILYEELEETAGLAAARKLDKMMLELREKQKVRRLMTNFRERTYKEYSIPMKVKRKVVMENGSVDYEMMEILMCPQSFFIAMGLPFTLWHMPHRPNYSEEIPCSNGIAGLGLPVDNPADARIVEALEQEKLNRLAWATESKPFETLSAQMRGLILDEVRCPTPGEHVEPPGTTAARTAAPPGLGVV